MSVGGSSACSIRCSHPGKRANSENDLFAHGDKRAILLEYDRLRYRLLPYIYALAWDVTDRSGTIMRPLVMDWRTDERVWNIGDQFMFGPALMVAPVTRAGQTSRQVFLPRTAGWYDFWTGKSVGADRWIDAPGPAFDRIPLFARARGDPAAGRAGGLRRSGPAGAGRAAGLCRRRRDLHAL